MPFQRPPPARNGHHTKSTPPNSNGLTVGNGSAGSLTSPSPEALRSRRVTTPATSSSNGGGKRNHHSPSILPMYAGSSSSTPLKKQAAHSSFLLGGTYYPGKDKKTYRPGAIRRRQRRSASSSKASLFFSRLTAPTRAGRRRRRNLATALCAVLTMVLLVLFLWVPPDSALRRSSHRHHYFRPHRNEPEGWWWTTTDSEEALKLPDRDSVLRAADQLQKERERLVPRRRHDGRQRLQVLERLVPEWYHRNDPPPLRRDDKQPSQAGHGDQKRRPVEHGSRHTDEKKKLDRVVENTKKAKRENQKTFKEHGHPVSKDRTGTNSALSKDKAAHKDAAASNAINHDKHEDTAVKVVKRRAQEETEPLDRDEKAKKSEKKMAPLRETPRRHHENAEQNSHGSSNTVRHHSSPPPLRTIHNMELFANQSHCPSDLSENDIRTTLVIQSSLDRVWVLDETCSRWSDPIVAVIVLTDAQTHSETSAMLSGWEVKCPQLKIITHKMEASEEAASGYPVNHLRNLGLDAVETSHVLVLDVDFVPSQFLAHDVHHVLTVRQMIRNTTKAESSAVATKRTVVDDNLAALVIPAFQRVLPKPCTTEEECKKFLRHDRSFIPRDFDDLKRCVKGRVCSVFQSTTNWEGHHSTRTERWLAGDWYEDNPAAKHSDSKNNKHELKVASLLDAKSIPCFDSLRYEPYVVIRWCPAMADPKPGPKVKKLATARSRPVAPWYDERFHGYGKNKIEYVQHLRLMGYQFSVLPKGFVVHNPHVESKAKESWNNVKESDLHAAMDRLYPQFLKEIVEKYHPFTHDSGGDTPTVSNHSIVGLCSDKK